MLIASPHLMPRLAIIDPLLTVTMPKGITAATGLDALTHAIEAYTSLKASVVSNMWAEQSIRLIGRNLRIAYCNGNDLSARDAMLMASFLAGVAFAAAGVAAVHALAHTVGGMHQVPHGLANALLLPYVMEFNRMGCREQFARIASFLGEPVNGLSLDVASERAVESVWRLSQDLGIPGRLRDFDIPEDSIDLTAERAIEAEARLLGNNPRVFGREEAKQILRRAY